MLYFCSLDFFNGKVVSEILPEGRSEMLNVCQIVM